MPTNHRRVLATLFAAIFATVAGSGIALPLLPLHAQGLGGGGLVIGTLLAAYALGRMLASWVASRLAERVGRKPVLIAGLFAYALVSVGFALTPGATTLVLVRILHGAASAMLMPVFQAYVADMAPAGREGRIMGWNGSVVLTGLAIGPWLGGLVADHAGINAAFALMGTLALAGAALCATMLPSARFEPGRTHTPSRAWAALIREREVAGLCAIRFAYVACVGMIWSFVPLYATHTLALSASTTGAIIALGILASGLLSTPAGHLADRLDRRSLITVGGCTASAGMAILAFLPDTLELTGAILAFGVAGGISTPAIMAMATRIGQRRESSGAVMGLLTVAHAAGLACGAMLGGAILVRGQLDTVFAAGATAMVAGTLVFAVTSAVVVTSHVTGTAPHVDPTAHPSINFPR